MVAHHPAQPLEVRVAQSPARNGENDDILDGNVLTFGSNKGVDEPGRIPDGPLICTQAGQLIG